MLLSPPPAPIIHQEVIRTGLDGLSDDQVVTVAYALLASGGREEGGLLDQLHERLENDGLVERLIGMRAQRAVRCSPFSIDEDSAWAHASYWVRGRSSYSSWQRRRRAESVW